ncbi:MAG: stage III sporulation protein AE [Clostridia bacterium]|nr:stage III sporulation protein AE [Clostridia bacterium]
MRKLCVIIIAAFFVFCVPCVCFADEDVDLILKQELDVLDFSAWNYSDDEFNVNARNMIENYLSGDAKVNAQGITDYLIHRLKSTVLSKLPLMLMLIATGLLSGVYTSFIPEKKSGLREILGFVTVAMCSASILGAAVSVISSAADAITKTSDFAQSVLPIMSVIMIASGRKATEAVFSPVMAFLSGTGTLFLKNIIMPLIAAGFVLAFLNALGSKGRTSRLLGLAKSSIKWICGIFTAVFSGIVGIYGLGAKAHDTLMMKTTKYVLDKSVPFVGSFLSGAADTVLECFTAIKSASGVVVILILVLIALKPLFDILCTVLALRISAALCEPVADERLPKLMGDTADVAKFLFAAVALITVMFVIAVGLCACIFT